MWKNGVFGQALYRLFWDVTHPTTSVTVNWISTPPTTMVSGQTYPVSWTISGATSLDHVNVHWDPTDPTAANCSSSLSCSTISPGTLPINGSATITAPTVISPTPLKYAVHFRMTSGGQNYYSNVISVTINPAPVTTDTTPNPFSFTSKTGVARNTTVTSNSITVSGINAPAPISIAGGSYSFNGVTFTSTAGTVSNGQTVTVRQTSSNNFNTISTATLMIGGVSGNFKVTTKAPSTTPDTTPNAFVFSPKTGVARNTLVTSNFIQVSGINAPANISITGGTYNINGGTFIGTVSTISNGQTVTVRQTSAGSFNTITTATLTIGGVSAIFKVTTLPPPTAGTGSIRVSIFPHPAAANAGAQWRVLGESIWRNSGTIKPNVPFGPYQIEFKTITGWTTPPDSAVTVNINNLNPWINSAPYTQIIATPVISFSPTTPFTFAAQEGGSNPGAQTLGISNSGGGTLSWSVSDNATWLSLSPASGTSTGETDNVTVAVNIAGLTAGTYTATLRITASGATNTPQPIPVNLTVTSPSTNTWTVMPIDKANDRPNSVGFFSEIEVDSSNNVHISHLMWNGNLFHVTDSSGAWTQEFIAPSGNISAMSPMSLAIDTFGHLHLSYRHNSDKDLIYSTNKSGSWQTEILDSATDVGTYSSITVDSSGGIHISYQDETNHNLKYITNKNGPWASTTVDNFSATGFGTAIALDGVGVVHISYIDGANLQLKYASNTSGSWSTTIIDNNVLGQFSSGLTSIVIDSTNKIHIAYRNNTGSGHLRHATNASGTWQATTIDGSGSVKRRTSMAIDSNNKLHIAYEIAGKVAYATNTSGLWITTSNVASGSDPDIEVDSTGHVHISFYQDNGDTELFYATNSPVPTLRYTLSVQKEGTGSGLVTSTPAGINCGGDCDEQIPKDTDQISLTQLADSGSAFSAWGGACTGTGTCAVTPDSVKSVTATFDLMPPTNQPPNVNAGLDQTVTLPASASLNGAVTDDGLPNPPGAVTTTWTKVSGPGTVSFVNASTKVTTASFSQSGTYVLRLTATDGVLSAIDDIQITVNPVIPPGPTPDFTLSPLGSSLTIQQGNSGLKTYTITSLNGFNAAVTLALTGKPTGVTGSFTPNPVAPPANSSANTSLTINVGANVACETYNLTVTGTSGSLTHTANINLDVTGCGGLKGEYYNNADLSDLILTRTDPIIDFMDWDTGSPDPTIDPDTFSVRWTGKIQADFAETYTFNATIDDGVRLWIDGHIIADHWQTGGASLNSTTALTAGLHDIKLEFFENTGDAFVQLYWSSPSTPQEIIPQAHLFPPDSSGTPPVLDWTGELGYTSDGLAPQAGDTNTSFTYRIKYTDTDGDPPLTGYPRLHILKDGKEITDSPFVMTHEIGDFTDGAIYTYSTTLTEEAGYSYYLDANDLGGLQAVASPTQPSPTIPFNAPDVGSGSLLPSGDMDGSGRVDGFDLGRLGLAFGSQPGDLNWDAAADLNQDGIVDDTDLNILKINFGKTK